MTDCTFSQCLPVCISGLVAFVWTAVQEFRRYKEVRTIMPVVTAYNNNLVVPTK